MARFDAMPNLDDLTTLRSLRDELYAGFGRRGDALFDLMDALLTARTIPSVVHLSVEAAHRRGWGSLDAALRWGSLDAEALRTLLARHPLADGQRVYAIDVSVWPRCDAETSPGRGFYYHPSRHSNGKPIVAGWADQWLAQLGFARASWTAPLDVQRVHPSQDVHDVAIKQIKACVGRLPASEPTVPRFVFDAGYDPVKLALGLADTRAAILVRLRRDRCFSADADPAAYVGNGRPRRHGAKFACQDPTTWPVPTADDATDDPLYGHVRVRAWAGLHAITKTHDTVGSRQPRPIVRGTVLRVEVAQLPRQTRQPRQLWLFWYGPGEPDLRLIWQAYVRRFDVEHTLRFFKQTLHWTVPQIRLPEQADLGTWLVLLAYTHLRLARPWVHDQRLPWEQRLQADKLTPTRVRRAFSAVRSLLGTPANAPKPCGRSPGRPRGRRSGPAPLCPVLKKAA
jgi:hypothetical protein